MIARVRCIAGVAVLGAASACGSASKNPAEVGGGDGGGAAASGGALEVNGGGGAAGGSGATGGKTSASDGGAPLAGTANQGGTAGGTRAASGGSAGARTAGGAAGQAGESSSAGRSATGGSGGNGQGGAPSDCFGSDIDVPLFVVSGTLTSTGARTANTNRLVYRSGLDRLSVGAGASANAYTLRVVPGTYDIFYDDLSPLRLGVTVGPSSPTKIDLEAKLAQLSFTVTVNGSPPSSTLGQLLSLKNMYGTKSLGDLSATPASIDVTPGSYDLVYDGLGGANLMPRNSGVKLQTLNVASSDVAVSVDIPSVVLTGHVERGGKPLLGSSPGVALATLVSADLGRVPIGVNEAGEYSVRVLPGSYDVQDQSGNIVPGSRISATANMALDIEIPEPPAYSAIVQGSLKFNGQAVSDVWGLTFHETTSGIDMSLTSSSDSYRFDALPGTYDIFYQVSRTSLTSPSMPRNRRGLLKRSTLLKANASTMLDLDVAVGVLKGKFTIGGAALPEVSGDGSLVLRDGLGDEIPFDANYDGEYLLPVVAGEYEAYFKVGLFGSVAPRNTGKKIQNVVVSPGEHAVDIDVPTRHIQGALKINGASAAGTTDLASITLRSENGDTVPLGSASSKAYSTTVVPGIYDVYFSGRLGNTFAPVNADAKIGCLRVP